MSYTIHYDPTQSESRSLISFLDHFSIPYAPVVWENDAHLADPVFAKKNPLLDLPLLESNVISLTGAHTIIRYLADVLLGDDHPFYPKSNLPLR